MCQPDESHDDVISVLKVSYGISAEPLTPKNWSIEVSLSRNDIEGDSVGLTDWMQDTIRK